ncbi:MAG: DUF4416 family protein [Thermodesulfobacteriota bacterium]
MSRPGVPAPCVLVSGLLRSPSVSPEKLLPELEEQFGPVRASSGEEPFAQSRYYDGEMGSGLLRSFLAFEGVRDPGGLVRLKLAANALEEAWAGPRGREVNFDPGLLNLTQVVLASGKPAAHRAYLGQGIYAEVELVFERGSFRPLPWTYPDYREPRALAFFNEVRDGHKRRLRSAAASFSNVQRTTSNGQTP